MRTRLTIASFILIAVIASGIWYVLSFSEVGYGDGDCEQQDNEQLQHYVLFWDSDNMRRDRSFLETDAFEGTQRVYSWRQLEPEKDRYDFSAIDEDLAFLESHCKSLFIQLQDVSFNEQNIRIPDYLLNEAQYNGGADRQYYDGDEENPVTLGWVARRWDPAVQERMYLLFSALGDSFDGRIEGINLPETAIEFGETGQLFPADFNPGTYQNAVIANMQALDEAFTQSVTMQYANFMPGEWLPDDDNGYLLSVYNTAVELNMAVGSPDLLPYRPGQLAHAYPLMNEVGDLIPTGIAVQEGNYAAQNPLTDEPPTIEDLVKFAVQNLKVDYIFWSTEEPFYSNDLIPYLLQNSN